MDRIEIVEDLWDIWGSTPAGSKTVAVPHDLVAGLIALLKEQDAVEPKTDDAWPSRIKTCGACGTCLFAVGDYKPKYCSECGRAVKWE